MNRAATQQELDTIKELWGKKTINEIANILNRSGNFVYMKARAMNLGGSGIYMPRGTFKWNEQNENALREMCAAFIPTTTIMRKLGCSYSMLTVKKIQMGLVPTKWTDSMIKVYNERKNSVTLRYLAKCLSLPYSVVYARASRDPEYRGKRDEEDEVQTHKRPVRRSVKDIEADIAKATELKDIIRLERELSCASLHENKDITIYSGYGD